MTIYSEWKSWTREAEDRPQWRVIGKAYAQQWTTIGYRTTIDDDDDDRKNLSTFNRVQADE